MKAAPSPPLPAGYFSPVTATAPPDGQVIAGRSLAVRYLNFVKFPHTLFALPFALLGVVAASLQAPVGWRLVLLVVVAFSAARWVALGLNMIADIRFDSANPRNRGRPLPQGHLTLSQAWASVVVAAAVFLAAAAAINPITRLLAPLALGWVALYALAKRFTHWPHLWLGMSLAIAPVGGWLAVTGRWSDPWWVLASITVAVATWVAGFDIFYALPDEQFDRSQGLRSAVVRLGVPRAMLVAKLLHGVTIPALALFGWRVGFGAVYHVGVVVAAGVLAYEHRLVRPDDLSKLGAAFFNMNAILSGTVFVFALVDRLI